MVITITPAVHGGPGDFIGVLDPRRGDISETAMFFCRVHRHTPRLVIRSVAADEVELEIDTCCQAARDRVESLLEEEDPD